MQTECSPELSILQFWKRLFLAGFDGGASHLSGRCCCSRRIVRSGWWIGLRDASSIDDLRRKSNTLLRPWGGQRVFGIALGYENVNDHDDLRQDPVLAGKLEAFVPSRLLRLLLLCAAVRLLPPASVGGEAAAVETSMPCRRARGGRAGRGARWPTRIVLQADSVLQATR